MNIKYYRYLYQSAAAGMRFSACFAGEGEPLHFYAVYISKNTTTKEKTVKEDIPAEKISALVLGDLEEETVERAVQLEKICGAEHIYIPCEAAGKALRERVSAKVTEVEDFCELKADICCLRMFAADGKLILYMGSEGLSPHTVECVMNVKVSDETLPCSPILDPENLNCEMRCLLCRDITRCKRQNWKGSGGFVDGHLLTGAADMKSCLSKLREKLFGEWKKIRFVWMPGGGDAGLWDSDLLSAGSPGHRRYFIGDPGADKVVIKEAVKDLERDAALVGNGKGLCISGCYAER